jgi:3-oxoacyl-(acyl-carrier-protein) synthase
MMAGRSGRVALSGLGEIAAAVGEALDLAGPRLTNSAACASGLHALIRGAMMIRQGDVDAALIVGAESSLQEIFLASFQRLGLLPDPRIGCRPMDQTRDGLLTSEAAAAVWVVRSDAAGIERCGNAIAIESMALGAEAHHLTGVDPKATTLRRLIDKTLADRGVDLVHAHATGTRANDPVELQAIDDGLFSRGGRAIAYSHKGALGHSLGASGMVSTVLAIKSHQSGIVPGNVRTEHPLATRTLRIEKEPIHATIARTLILAAGFGGPVATVCLKSR